MPMDLDDLDLYPPDHEDLTPEVRQHRNRIAAGTALVVWGTSMLVERALGIDLDTFFLGLGFAALAAWSQHRRYGWFVAGAIATGVGVGDLLSGPLGNAFGTSIANLSIAAGFAAIYVRYPRRSTWAIAVAGVFTLIAVGAFGIGLIGLVPAGVGRLLLPLMLIGAGVLLLLRHSLPPKAVKLGLAGLALSFVLIAATTVPNAERVQVEHAVPWFGGEALPPLAGKTLVLEGGHGDLELRRSEDGAARLDLAEGTDPGSTGRVGSPGRPSRVAGSGFTVEEDGDRVIIDVGGRHAPFGRPSSRRHVLTLPEGVGLQIERTSGDITGDLAGARGTIRTGHGNIDVTLHDGGAEGSDGDGPYAFETGDGDVTIDGRVGLVLDIEVDDGRITVDGQPVDDDEYESEDDATGVPVEIDVEDGDARVLRR